MLFQVIHIKLYTLKLLVSILSLEMNYLTLYVFLNKIMSVIGTILLSNYIYFKVQ